MRLLRFTRSQFLNTRLTTNPIMRLLGAERKAHPGRTVHDPQIRTFCKLQSRSRFRSFGLGACVSCAGAFNR